MNCLVGYGLSSESESDEEDNINEVGHADGKGDGVSDGKITRNFLLESGSTSSESENESVTAAEKRKQSFSPPHPQIPPSSAAVCQPTRSGPPLGSLTPIKLPAPSLNSCLDSGVFANPFKAQADQKLTVLQKHVPLTMHANPSHIGGKRMCVSYRKDGRCRFGIKCKFAHDSDLQNPATLSDCPPQVSEETSSVQADSPGGGSHKQGSKEKSKRGQQVKKRVGLSNTLIPPKRAMKQYATQRDKEQINMS